MFFPEPFDFFRVLYYNDADSGATRGKEAVTWLLI